MLRTHKRTHKLVAAFLISGAALFAGAAPASAAPVFFTVTNGGTGPVQVKAAAFEGLLVSITQGCLIAGPQDVDPTASFVVCLPGGATLAFGVNVP